MEYAILITLISAVIIVTVGFLGTNKREAFNSVSPAFPTEKQDKGKDSPDDSDCGNGLLCVVVICVIRIVSLLPSLLCPSLWFLREVAWFPPPCCRSR